MYTSSFTVPCCNLDTAMPQKNFDIGQFGRYLQCGFFLLDLFELQGLGPISGQSPLVRHGVGHVGHQSNGEMEKWLQGYKVKGARSEGGTSVCIMPCITSTLKHQAGCLKIDPFCQRAAMTCLPFGAKLNYKFRFGNGPVCDDTCGTQSAH